MAFKRLLLAATVLMAGCAPSGPQMVVNASPPPSEAAAGEFPKAKYDALLAVLGDLPERPKAGATVLESVRLPTGWRYKIEYLAEPADPRFDEPADMIRAYLFVPDHAPSEKLPAIIAVHQDGPHTHLGKSEPAGLAGAKDQFYGLELFQRGYVVLAADRVAHAERRRVVPNDLTSVDSQRDGSLLQHRVGQLLLKGRTLSGKEVYDLMRGADIVTALDYVDADRLGVIGFSAGGYAATYFMFADPRVKVGVSSAGFFDLTRFFNENAPQRRWTAVALPGLTKAGVAADYLAFIAPRPLLLTRGLWEWGGEGKWKTFSEAHVQETRDMEAHARRRYRELNADHALRVEYFDDQGGDHAFPPRVREVAYAWLDSTLRLKDRSPSQK